MPSFAMPMRSVIRSPPAPPTSLKATAPPNPRASPCSGGFTTYATIRELGRDGIAALIDRCCEHAHAIVMGIAALPGAEIVWEPTLNQGLVRFPSPKPDASAADHAAHTDAVIAAINAGGEAFFSPTTWNGIRCMRVSVCGWLTNSQDVKRTIAATAEAIAAMQFNED
jgi:glutamate/tyrosine decarboxylase-like PLP-dependent enzyme